MPVLRFTFDIDVADCTVRDVQPLAGFPGDAIFVARGGARLALELALHSGDRKLADHLALAIIRDTATTVWRGGHISDPLSADDLLKSRADAWARVWAYLAGDPQPLMGHPGPHRDNPPRVWVLVHFHDATGDLAKLQRRIGLSWERAGCAVCRTGDEEMIWSVSAAIEPRSTDRRGYRIDPAKRTEALRWAGKLAGAASVIVEWGLFGWGADGSARRLGHARRVLPTGARAARNLVEGLLRDVETRVRGSRVLRLPTYQRLEMYPGHVAVYLLHGLPNPGAPPRGYGGLPGLGWRMTAESFCGESVRDSDDHANRQHAEVRSRYRAALRLIDNWRAIAPPP